jgi:hypothetical protein
MNDHLKDALAAHVQAEVVKLGLPTLNPAQIAAFVQLVISTIAQAIAILSNQQPTPPAPSGS